MNRLCDSCGAPYTYRAPVPDMSGVLGHYCPSCRDKTPQERMTAGLESDRLRRASILTDIEAGDVELDVWSVSRALGIQARDMDVNGDGNPYVTNMLFDHAGESIFIVRETNDGEQVLIGEIKTVEDLVHFSHVIEVMES